MIELTKKLYLSDKQINKIIKKGNIVVYLHIFLKMIITNAYKDIFKIINTEIVKFNFYKVIKIHCKNIVL